MQRVSEAIYNLLTWHSDEQGLEQGVSMNSNAHFSRFFVACTVAALTASACSSETAAPSQSGPAQSSTPATIGIEAPATDPSVVSEVSTAPIPVASSDQLAAAAKAVNERVPGCEQLDPRHCLLPFPSDFYTEADTASDTGLRVSLPNDTTDSALANAQGTPIDFTEWNRNDGFSPNSTLLTLVPDLDDTKTDLPPWTDLDASLADDSTVVLVDTANGERVPLWAELDAKASGALDRLLVIHPAVVLTEGHRYVVGLRHMVGTDGVTIEPNTIFMAYRDAYDLPELAARQPAMEQIFTDLETAGVQRDDLFLAWDFTVASQRNISERMLSIRDQALATLGDVAPAFTVTAATPNPEELIALRIEGTYTVPNFLTGDGGPGNSFFYAPMLTLTPDFLPTQNGTVEVGFACNISTTTMEGTEPAHLVQYGHGLLGSNFEINAGNVRAFASEHNAVICATKWAGMSEDDIANAAATLGEISNFNTVADRLQQGVLNQIFLGRLMTRDGGLSSLTELQRPDGSLMIDTAHLDYDGNSQGAIMGIMLAAVSPDIERAVFGVPGINYSLLLPRSVDFETYEAIFAPAYPDELDRMIILDLLQMLWDRGEGGGYVSHLTSDPYPNTPAKPVLFDVAFGDWQVSELSAFIAARATGATIHRPVTADGRSDEVDPGWGLETTKYPSTGSAIIIWDSGSDSIPFEGRPPFTSRDPHEDPRADVDVRTQKASFLFEDLLIDVCDAQPCLADNSD
jgi:hypothetical protein